MNSWFFRRAVLAISVGLALVTGLVRAQDARPLPAGNSAPLPAPAPAPAPTPAVTVEAGVGSYPDVAGKHSRIHDCLHRHGLHCFSDLGSLGCGSLKSDCKFIFGSCRDFFGESCTPQTPGDHGRLGNGKGGCSSCQ